MTPEEKRLYHQIHPAKLFTDISTALISAYLCWEHTLVVAIIVAFIPSIIVTVTLLKVASLERFRDSHLGRYVKAYMDSRTIDTLRLGGFFIAAIGAWYHLVLAICVGAALILFCWSRGLLVKNTRNAA